MARDSQNIYKNARKSAGLTQEKAAQYLNVSVDSLRDYEGDERPVPNDVASAMCDVYQVPYLAVQHLRQSSKLGGAGRSRNPAQGFPGSRSGRSGRCSAVRGKARRYDRDCRRRAGHRGRAGRVERDSEAH